VCVCVCVCVCARACVRVCVCAHARALPCLSICIVSSERVFMNDSGLQFLWLSIVVFKWTFSKKKFRALSSGGAALQNAAFGVPS
jgi:hypothetical protein